MTPALLYALVVFSAIAHPIWNALVKSAGDRTLAMVTIRVAGLAFGLAVLPFVDWPAPESWKWIALTAVIQFGYYALLIRSYELGDMGVVYPLARGIAPVLTTLVAFFAIGESLSAAHLAAVGLISLGIMALSFGTGASLPAVGFALATGVSVAAYSLSGGVGARAAGTVLGFQACLEIVNGLARVGYALTAKRAAIPAYARRYGAVGLFAGIVSVLGFLAFLLAARGLPLGPVVALRETSVIFGAIIGTFILKEGFGPRRIAASVLVVGGIAMLAFLR